MGHAEFLAASLPVVYMALTCDFARHLQHKTWAQLANTKTAPRRVHMLQQRPPGPGVNAPAPDAGATPRAQVWALKSYTKSAPLYVQVLQRSSLGLISPFLDPERDVIVSVEQTRHRLLALSCLCPGASTLIGAGPLPTCA